MIPQTWQDEALCAQVDTDIFFPDRGGSTRAPKEICSRCPVRDACLKFAQDHAIEHGIYGGLTPDERGALKLTANHFGELETFRDLWMRRVPRAVIEARTGISQGRQDYLVRRYITAADKDNRDRDLANRIVELRGLGLSWQEVANSTGVHHERARYLFGIASKRFAA